MTCIVAIKHEGAVYIGSDAGAVDPSNYSMHVQDDPKSFKLSGEVEMIIGYSGSWRAGQLIRYSLTLPEHSPKKTDMAYIVTDVVDALMELLRSNNTLKKENEKEETDADIVIGYRGEIYVVDGNFAVMKPMNGYVAIGSGGDIALGALYASGLTQKKMSPKERLKLALEASATFTAGIMPPFNFVELPAV